MQINNAGLTVVVILHGIDFASVFLRFNDWILAFFVFDCILTYDSCVILSVQKYDKWEILILQG
jgi:hypothetical protein